MVTLVRALQSQGFGTRRHCALRVRRGEVAVNGVVCDDPDAEFDQDGLTFMLDGTAWPYRPRAYLAMYKPAGYECSHKPSHHPSVFSLLPPPLIQRGVQCIGRLDQDTTGLLLFSDDGQFQHRMISPKRHVAKIYRATCAAPVTDEQLAALQSGVHLNDEPGPVAALMCERIDGHTLRLALAEGKYHQVKRMIAAAGNHVAALHREAVGAYRLPEEIKPGQWRWLAPDALTRLEQAWPSDPS
ncbi:pseudouridine synthase [Betaproteobacteria bacterium SCN1]|jgi:16S rRNA pseudouridine516 synthase|nr:pseudouridine synthase [Betaproteobacteria bacterium SCN1]